MLYKKNKKEGVKKSYDYLHLQEHVNDNAKKRRKKVRTFLNGTPKK
tara:strand:+ start:2396 stop:2533 length:138 start_codon:yes stop_codon:yes gene_type:complete